ncbi:hypothetical protein PV10_00917 [Exophiala mesophila]|uniref:Uncharacterized protein n=1 Tax=Exophiala mesophila TaxID=212818 RepID=A0A0D1ZT90_EXOME|nr:uncharacterized protein PV10_00917 [Exophiala mesophila]KIV97129.1 hypothetical protein PV10_00917 [Exophiala mesophila]
MSSKRQTISPIPAEVRQKDKHDIYHPTSSHNNIVLIKHHQNTMPSTIVNEKSNIATEVASIRSTSTASSSRSLLPKQSHSQDKKALAKETPEQKALKMQARATHFALR